MADCMQEWPEPVVRVQALAESGLDAIPCCYVKPPCDRAVKQLAADVQEQDAIPCCYVKPPWDRPVMQLAADVQEHSGISIPVIDLGELLFEGGLSNLTEAVAAACREWGFFQVVNHGVWPELIRAAREAWRGFFRLPHPAKQKYANSPRTYEGYGNRVGVENGAVLDWGDYYFLHLWPEATKSLAKYWPANPGICKLSKGTPLKSSGYGENRHESKMFALVAPQSLASGDGSSSSTGAPVPLLWLDSGAAIHVVGDAEILTNLRDPPTEMAVTVADGSQLPITKVGVIQAPGINISDVYLAPGLKMNLISVRQLAKSKIVSIFYENHAELWLEEERIGGAIVDNVESLYRLYYFEPHA